MRLKKLLCCVLSLAMVFSLFSSLGLTFTASAGHYDWDLESPLERNKTLADWDTLHEMIANKEQPLRWVLTGSSTTANSGNYSNSYRSYSEILESRMKTEFGRTEDVFINSAVGGWKVPNVSATTTIEDYNPDIAYYAIGKNDADGSVTPEDYYVGLTLLIVQAREAGILPIIATANGLGTGYSTKDTYDSVYAPIIRQVAYEQDAILVDHNAHWLNNEAKAEKEWFRSDNLHCNQKGYLELAQTIFRDLGLWDENSIYCQLRSDDIDNELPLPFFGDEDEGIQTFDPDHGVEPLIRWQVNKSWDGSQKLMDVSDATTADGQKVLDVLNSSDMTSGTLVFRYRTTSTASAKRFFGVSDATGTGFVLGAGSEGRAWALPLSKGSTGTLLRMGATNLSDGQWHTVVLVADDNSLTLYEEGTKYDLTTSAGTFNPFNTNGKGTYTSIVIGGNLNGAGGEGNQFVGDVSYIEILEEMLTEEQAIAISKENDDMNADDSTEPEDPDASNPTHAGGVIPDVRFQVNKSYNGSQNLDYFNDAVTTGGESLLDVMNDPAVTSGTFIYRYKTTSTAAGKRMFSISDDNGNGFTIGGTSEGRNWALPINGGAAGSPLLRLDPTGLGDGEWHTVVLVCADGVLYHYVDGVKYDMSSASGAFNPFHTNSKGSYTKIMFGGNLNGSGAESGKFIGDVSYLDILTTTLTDEQALAISKESMKPSEYAIDGDTSQQNGFVYDGDSAGTTYPESTFSGIASAYSAGTNFVFYGGANILGTMDTVVERNFIHYFITNNINGRQASFTGSMADLTAALENPNFTGGEVVVLMPEVYDSWMNQLLDTDETAFKQSLYDFVAKALIRNNSRVLLITPAPLYGDNEALNDTVSRYAEWTREFAAQYGLPLIDLNLYFSDAAAKSEQVKRNWFTDDGFMNHVAHAEAARLLCQALGVSNGGIDNKTFRNESVNSGEEYDNLAPVVTLNGTTATIDFSNLLSDAQYKGQTLSFQVKQTVNGETTELTLTPDGNTFTVTGLDENALYTFELIGTVSGKTVHFKTVCVSTVSDVDAVLEQLKADAKEVAAKVGDVEGSLRADRLRDLTAAIAAVEAADEADRVMLAAKALLLSEKAKTDVVTLDRTCLENLVARLEEQELVPDAVAKARTALTSQLTQTGLTDAYAKLYAAQAQATTPAIPAEDATDTFTRAEAESGLLSSGQISSDTNASGGQKLTHMAGTPTPNVKFIIDAPQAGIYTMKVGFATNTDNLPLVVIANTHYTITRVNATASMNTYAEALVKIQLDEGENILTVRGSDDADRYLDLDYIEIQTTLTRLNKDANIDRGYFEAEWAEAYRCKINLEDGFGYVTNIWDNDNAEYASRLRFNVNADTAGGYTMTVRYRVTKVYSANNNLAQHNLTINGQSAGTVDYGTGTSSWKTVQVPVTLIAGANTIAFSKSVAQMGDVDIDVIHLNFTEKWTDDYLNGKPDITLGDVNNDGAIDSRDARMVLQSAVDAIDLTDDQKVAANINEDEAIDSKDARQILQIAVQ